MGAGDVRAMSTETPVLIVGGGPVGLVLAIELAAKGVRCLLVNDGPTTAQHPQGNSHNSRTMEHYRRLGFAGEVRRTGLPADHCTDVAYLTRFAGYELARLPMPSANEKMAAARPGGASQLTPEPIHRSNQYYVEPVLKRRAEALAAADLRFGWRLNAFVQRADQVSAEIEQVETGRSEIIACRYLVGCDGARSTVRQALGIGYQGKTGSEQEFFDGRMLSAYVSAPDLPAIMTMAPAWQHWTVNADARTATITLDGKGRYLILAGLDRDAPLEAVEPAGLLRAAAGVDLDVEVLSVREWVAGHALVADRYRDERVFLAGDSAHLFTPTGGFGMNTGIDDIANLGWKLAATCLGWGGNGLLASYEVERHPIGRRNTRASREFAGAVTRVEIPGELEDASAAGARAREKMGKHLSGFTEEFASLGIQLGARYDGSPIIVPDGTDPPSDSPFNYGPSACPGGRAPHIWLADGASILDRFGPWFTLLRFGAPVAASGALEAAARKRGVPLHVADIEESDARELYECRLALIRPDRHVAWRGDRSPDEPLAIIDRMIGCS